MKAIYMSFYKVCRLPSTQCMSDLYFIVPLFVFEKHILFNLFSTNYKLQVNFPLEFGMPCHRTIRYFKGSICLADGST